MVWIAETMALRCGVSLTRMWIVRFCFGITWARSVSLTVCWGWVFRGAMRRLERRVGRERGPARRVVRSVWRRVRAVAISVSRVVKSEGSSGGVGGLVPFWVVGSGGLASRGALAPFLRRWGVVVKGRWCEGVVVHGSGVVGARWALCSRVLLLALVLVLSYSG